MTHENKTAHDCAFLALSYIDNGAIFNLKCNKSLRTSAARALVLIYLFIVPHFHSKNDRTNKSPHQPLGGALGLLHHFILVATVCS